MHKIVIDREWFRDEQQRHVLFRGANIGPKIPCYLSPEHHQVSFTGAPFSVEEADEHFARLRYWGFNCLRYIVTWEAIEHRGPGIYDETFLSYLTNIIAKAREYQLYILIDMHQDVWSRFTGGCGAPGWTLELVGFDLESLEKTGATILSKDDTTNSMAHILWATNAYKLATATMFTLFFGGNLFAPRCMVNRENIQVFLQNAYVNAMKRIAKALKHLPNVIGFDIMNEPIRGYIEWKDLRNYEGFFSLGYTPTPFQSMALGNGDPQIVEYWQKSLFGMKKAGLRLIDPQGCTAWKKGKECIWKEHGVWEYSSQGQPHLLHPHYFTYYKNRRIHFTEDFYRPFIKFVAGQLRKIQPETMIFVENEVFRKPPVWGIDDPVNIAFSTHWYDAYVLALKRFCPFLGVDMIKQSWRFTLPHWMRRFFAAQIQRLKNFARDRLGIVPTMITEFGIAFDMDKKRAYRTENFSKQMKALNRSFQAIEDNMLSCTIWNYFPNHSRKYGDGWNNEDLSIYSRNPEDQEGDPYAGARAKYALVRPYPIYTPGIPQYMNFDMKKHSFAFIYISEGICSGPLEIFLPHLHFGKRAQVVISDGTYDLDYANQKLLHYPAKGIYKHSICVYGGIEPPVKESM